MLQGAREKRNHIYMEKKTQTAVDLTSKTMEIKRKWHRVLQIIQEKIH